MRIGVGAGHRPHARRRLRIDRPRAIAIPPLKFGLGQHLRAFDEVVLQLAGDLRMHHVGLEAIEQKAIVEIELSGLKAQEALALAGLTTEAAKLFIDRLPSVETLMPKLSFSEIAGEAEPPVAEQLVSSNALRQRRYRDRLRNGNAQPALRDGSGDGRETP
jgi:hypothetical protein